MQISKAWRIGIDHSGIVLFCEHQRKQIHDQFKIGDSIYIPEKGIRIKSDFFDENESVEFSRNSQIEFVDAELLTGHVCQVRSVKPGDWFFPLGLNYRQKLSDFFVNQKIPFWDRHQTLVLLNGKDIVWIIGYRLDNRFKITGKSKKIIKFQVFDESDENLSQSQRGI